MNSKAAGLALTSAGVILWALKHQFLSLHGDAELYAFQALAKLNPALNSDLYLTFNSQDRYTIFPYLYAFLIAHLTLQTAELGLFVFCLALSLWAAFLASRTLFGSAIGWLSVGLLIVASSHYGAFEVFSYFEDYLTARSLAVALISVSLALYLCRYRFLAAAIATLALFLHPIMAFPGMLLLICMALPLRISAAAAILSCGAVLGAACIASETNTLAHLAPLMDPEWLDVVQERSQFLFLNIWRSTDWELAARAFITLTLAAMVARNVQVVKLCLVSMLIGISGLGVAWIAGSVGPVAILVQGQAWRWIWITTFVAVLLIAPTAVAAWRCSRVGPLVSSFFISGWVFEFSPTVNLLLVEIALVIWLTKDFVWMTGRGRLSVNTVMQRIGQVLAHAGSAAARAARGLQLPLMAQTASIRIALMAMLFTATLLAAHHSLIQSARATQILDPSEFTDWQSEIPPTSNVLMVPPPTNAAFVWIALNRPSYMSLNQSSGVVFARATAFEIRRRSEVLLPIADPDWKIRTRIIARNQLKPTAATPRKLTAEALAAICEDPQLGFVISKEELGYAHFRHDKPGPWQSWNLYDCKQVRPG